MRVRWGFVLCMLLGATAPAADDSADKFWAQQNKEALRDLERGKPAQQIKAASRLGAKFAAQTAPVLIRHLGANEGPIRLAAAEVLWEVGADEPGAFASAQPALRTALDDADAAVAMNAAGALAAMGVAEGELAAARRRVLAAGARDYVGFLAARGLAGIDPAPGLLPYLLDYFLDAVEAKARDHSADNVELAEKALARLVATKDRALIDPLLQALPASPPATRIEGMQLPQQERRRRVGPTRCCATPTVPIRTFAIALGACSAISAMSPRWSAGCRRRRGYWPTPRYAAWP